jgi:purine-binding chemotaxis protein CheW
MAEPSQTEAQDGEAARPYLTFRLDERLYALPADEVSEVIRVPAVARVPLGPRSLMGIGNLRGTVLLVASLRGLLGVAETDVVDASRAIVLSGANPVAVAVDRVDAVVSVGPGQVRTTEVELGAETGERLRGAFQLAGQGDVARILDIQPLLAEAFVPRARPAPKYASVGASQSTAQVETADDHLRLVTFEVAGQEFGLPLDEVAEIIPAPEGMATVPLSEALVLGVVGYRDNLLPLLSLRGLLGFPVTGNDRGREKVVVVKVADLLAGLVVDRMLAVVPAELNLIEPTPPMLAARIGGETRIKAIYRGDGGRRLISILSPQQLFREDVMQRLGQGDGVARRESHDEQVDALRFLVFRLGDDAFGLPIEAVDEVARVPDQVTRLPKTPAFLEGVINLRGEVLPVVDQRRRFDMEPLADGSRRRLVVVRTESHRAGLIVDSVSEVLRSHAGAIDRAPDLAGEATRLVSGVINLADEGRIVLVLDPAELLSRTERGLLDAFAGEPAQAST